MKPFLKWAGGKAWLAPAITELFHNLKIDTLVEPFVGAGSIFLHLEPDNFIANDSNPYLINLYKAIQNDGLELTIDVSNTKENFLSQRSTFNNLRANEDDESRRKVAEIFYFMNRTSFNGLCRFSKKTGYNVGWGYYKKPIIEPNFHEYTPLLKKGTFINGDFSSIDDHITRNSLIFADPPYHGDKVFRGYNENGFTLEDQSNLAVMLSTHDAPAIATNSFEPDIISIYKMQGFTTFKIDAPRRISCNGDRNSVPEMIAIKDICPKLFRRILKKHGHSIRIC